MANQILVDSSFLYALHNPRDKYWGDATAFALIDKRIRIVPDVALTEVAQMLKKYLGLRAVDTFLKAMSAPSIQLEPVTVADLERARAVMMQYASADLDFVDCCLIALAERLGITELCTFDRRDFSIARLKDGSFLELLP
jgi:predicted nucleic acid-binding protein